MSTDCGHGWHSPIDCDTCTLERVDPQAAARIAELEALVYVPGLWRCPKCKFGLLQSNLNAATGAVTARDTPGDKCPNCAGPLWRVTERQAGNDMVDRCEAAVIEAAALRKQLGRLIVVAHAEAGGNMTESQIATVTGLDRVAVRELEDAGRDDLHENPPAGLWAAGVLRRIGC